MNDKEFLKNEKEIVRLKQTIQDAEEKIKVLEAKKREYLLSKLEEKAAKSGVKLEDIVFKVISNE